MTSAGDLLSQLLAIDRSLAEGNLLGARALMPEAEDAVLRLQQELMDTLREKEALARRFDDLRDLKEALAATPQLPLPANVIPMPSRAHAPVTAALKPK